MCVPKLGFVLIISKIPMESGRELGPPELGPQVVVSREAWVLGPGIRASGGGARTLNSAAIFPSCFVIYLKSEMWHFLHTLTWIIQNTE